MGLSEDLERVALQERELRLPRLDAATAWDLGVCLRRMAEERGLAVVIDVRRFGQPLFYAAMEGTTPDNVEWVRRKSNVVARFLRSSYSVGLSLKQKGTTLETNGLDYVIGEGGGAFYGPKIDYHFTDSLKRSWQLGTVQLDYQAPERFDLVYTGADNADHRPIVLHRALMGSYERFIGILLEHTGGDLPFWLAPFHLAILPISDRHVEVAEQVAERARRAGVRVVVDTRTESVGRKIRDAELKKSPYMFVIGDREAEEGTASVRARHAGDLGSRPVDEVIAELSEQIASRRS